MNEQTDLDRILTAWLTADAPIREPEPLLDRVLTRTARTRRRAAWRIPERWFPVSTITTRVEGVSRFPWRTAAAVALLVLALTVGALVIAGRAKPVPAPFGPAGNGQILYTADDDIVAIDAPGVAPRTILGGATIDAGPVFSPDGLKFLFIRGPMFSSAAELWAADADGSKPQRLGAVPYVGWVDWSPQADVVAVSLDKGRSIIRMVATDGSGSTDIETGLKAAENPVFRPSDGKQIAFRGNADDGTWGIYVIGRDGTNMQRLDLDPGFATDPAYAVDRDSYFFAPTWSPDGGRLIYYTLEPDPTSPMGAGHRIHIADVSAAGAVTADRKLEFDREADDEFVPAWLPSGTGIVFQSLEGSVHRIFAADLSAGAQPRDLGIVGTEYIVSQVSPDGQKLLLSLPGATSDQRTFSVLDLATLTATPFSAASDDFAWQRTAQ